MSKSLAVSSWLPFLPIQHLKWFRGFKRFHKQLNRPINRPQVEFTMKIIIVPLFNDNYGYLLVDESTGVAAAVDPAKPAKVLEAAAREGVVINTVLTTHSHSDHSAGNKHMAEVLGSGAQIIGGINDLSPAVTREVGDGDIVEVGSLKVTCFLTPCHTPGHVLYLCEDSLFTGDTLFIAGCGRFNAGSPEQMHYALNTVVAGLPPATKIYCGHEYTSNNLKFASAVEPGNADIAKKLAWSQAQDEAKAPTVPSTVGDELATNVFMRLDQPEVLAFLGLPHSADPVGVMGGLRNAKNNFGCGAGASAR